MRNRITKILLWVAGVLTAVHLLLLFFPFDKLKEFKAQPFSHVYYDCQGQLLQVTPVAQGDRREYIDYKSIPRDVRKIILRTEDRRFYLHNGTDLIAITHAAVQNLQHKKIVRGGSTITMQLIKTIFQDKDVTISRKLRDIFYAYVLEAKLSKKKIFELYVNSIYFGYGSTGFASAARTFYGCTLDKLSPQQICCLAVIPRNPTFYDPFNANTNCADRACALYNKIYKQKLSVSQFMQYLPQKRFTYPFEAPHYIRDIAEKRPAQPQQTLTLNLELQHFAERTVRQGLDQAQGSRISNASLLLIENKTGTPLAWVGSADFFDEIHNGQIDGVLIRNQPGSSMKPFLYALALETPDPHGNPLFTPSTILADIPQEFGDEKLYIPSNFNNRYNGPIRLRIALASSLNVPAVYVLNTIGVPNYLNKLYELGFDSLRHDGIDADLGLALGAGEVKLCELVPAFSVFVRDGKDYSGKQIYKPDTARLICSFLSDKGARALGFGYTQTFQTDYPSIFKTGTSNQYQNIIALGATKKYTVGVWMGNFSGETVVGKTGSSLPAWVAKNLLDYLEEGQSVTQDMEFPEPENFEQKKICSLSGMLAGPNCPATVYEYFPKDNDHETKCTWHVKTAEGVQTLYPPEYQQWARRTKPDLKINYSDSPLYIQTPKDNSLFYYSQLQKEKQAVSVEVFGGAEEKLLVYYDEQFYGEIERPFVFQLPVEQGRHTCTVECGLEKQTISFLIK